MLGAKYTVKLKSSNNDIVAYRPIVLVLNLNNAKLYHLDFHSLKVVSRYRDPHLLVGEKYTYLFNLRPNICQILMFNFSFYSQ